MYTEKTLLKFKAFHNTVEAYNVVGLGPTTVPSQDCVGFLMRRFRTERDLTTSESQVKNTVNGSLILRRQSIAAIDLTKFELLWLETFKSLLLVRSKLFCSDVECFLILCVK